MTKPLPTDVNLRKLVRSRLRLQPVAPRSHAFHPSGMAFLCPVKYFFYDQAREAMGADDPEKRRWGFERLHKILNDPEHKVSPGGRFKPELLQEFDLGDAVHESVQYHLGLIGVLWGKWRCPSCDYTTGEQFMPRSVGRDHQGEPMDVPAPCVRCGGRNYRHDHRWIYVELPVAANEWEIDGHCDGDLRLPRDDDLKEMTLEIKSINEAGFMERIGPLPKPAHIEQASLYAWAKGHKYICFIYVCKNQLSRWKEFIVPVNLHAVSVAQAKIKAVVDARKTGKPPLHARVCQDCREDKARGCPLVEECFGETPPIDLFGV